jgi:hypothetical protein
MFHGNAGDNLIANNERRIRMEDQSRQYEIPDLRNHRQVMNKITELEKEIADLINKEVSLVVYAKET